MDTSPQAAITEFSHLPRLLDSQCRIQTLGLRLVRFFRRGGGHIIKSEGPRRGVQANAARGGASHCIARTSRQVAREPVSQKCAGLPPHIDRDYCEN